MRVLLICQFAASSKLLVQRMREAAKNQGGEPIEVESEAITNLDAIQLDAWDVVLLAPQARHYLKKVRERTATPVESIDMRAYGLADGAAALAQARTIAAQRK